MEDTSRILIGFSEDKDPGDHSDSKDQTPDSDPKDLERLAEAKGRKEETTSEVAPERAGSAVPAAQPRATCSFHISNTCPCSQVTGAASGRKHGARGVQRSHPQHNVKEKNISEGRRRPPAKGYRVDREKNSFCVVHNSQKNGNNPNACHLMKGLTKCGLAIQQNIT